MTTYYRGRRKWRRPATDFPDRRHAANVADAVHAARLEADAEQRAWFEDLLQTDSLSEGGDNAEDQGSQDQDPAS